MPVTAPAQTYALNLPAGAEPTEWDNTQVAWLNELTQFLPEQENGVINLAGLHALSNAVESVAHVPSVQDAPVIFAVLGLQDIVKKMTHEDANGNIRPQGFVGHSLHEALKGFNKSLADGPLQPTAEGADFFKKVEHRRNIYAAMSHSGLGSVSRSFNPS